MTKEQAVSAFWNSFGWLAYDETSVPDQEPLPYITHEIATDDFGHEVAQTASLWYRSTGWREITEKLHEIETKVTKGGIILAYDGGALWIRRGDPWAQRMSEASDDMIRRIVINYTIEYMD